MMLFGQSAGASDVYIIATLPEAPSLINSAISESLVLPSLTDRSAVQKAAISYAKVLDCDVGDVNTTPALSSTRANSEAEKMLPNQKRR